MQSSKPASFWNAGSACTCATSAAISGQRSVSIVERTNEAVRKKLARLMSAIDTAPFRDEKFVLRNTNHLVRTYQGCDGLKTGFYDKAGFNVVATARRGDLRFVAVVLGTPHKLTNFKEAAVLMSEGFANYEMRAVAKKGAPASQIVAVTGGTLEARRAGTNTANWPRISRATTPART